MESGYGLELDMGRLLLAKGRQIVYSSECLAAGRCFPYHHRVGKLHLLYTPFAPPPIPYHERFNNSINTSLEDLGTALLKTLDENLA